MKGLFRLYNHYGWPVYWDANDGGAGGGSGSNGDDSGDGNNNQNQNNQNQNNNSGGDGSGGNNQSQQNQQPKTITMTQEEFDKKIEDRLARDRKAREDEAAKKAEREKMDAEARAKAELADKDAIIKTRDMALKAAEARVIAVESGVKSEKLPHFLKLLTDELATVEVAADGTFDTAEVKKLVGKVLEDVPEFKTSTGGAAGRDTSGNGNNGVELTQEKIDKMTTEEYTKNLPAIEAFYKKKNQK
jgi:hypothetical protein